MKSSDLEKMDISDELKNLLYDGVREVAENLADKRLSAAIYLYMMASSVEDTTLKNVFERYEIEDIVYEDIPSYREYVCDGIRQMVKQCIMPYIEYECGFKLVPRKEPISLSYQHWNSIILAFGKHLQDKLKL